MKREEIAQQASLTVFPWDDVREQSKFEDGFVEGAEWMQKKIIDKACEWLYVYYPTLERAKSFEDAWEHFKKAMEE